MTDLPPDLSADEPGEPRRRLTEQEAFYLRWFLGVAGALVVGIVVLSVIVFTRDDDGTVVATEDTGVESAPEPTVEADPTAEADGEAGDEADEEPTPEETDEEPTPEPDEPEFPPCPDGAGPDPTQRYGVTGVNNQLNQRAEPDVEADKVGELPVGTRGLVLTGSCSQSEDGVIWWELGTEDDTVWVAASYLETEAVLDAGPCQQGTFDTSGRDRLTSVKADVDGDGAEDKVSFYTDTSGVAHGVIEYAYGAVSDTAYAANEIDGAPTDLAVVNAVRPRGIGRDVVIATGSVDGQPTYFLFSDGDCALTEVGIPNSDGAVRVAEVNAERAGNDLRCRPAGERVRLYDSRWEANRAGNVTETRVEIQFDTVTSGDATFVVGTPGSPGRSRLGNLADGPPTYTYGPC